MKTSNKLLIGFLAFVLASILTFMIYARMNVEALESPLGNDQEALDGSGRLGKETRSIPAFSELVLHTGMDVVLSKSAETLEVEAEDNIFSQIVTEVEDGSLSIYWKPDRWVNYTLPIKITVPIEQLSSIQLRDRGFISSLDTLHSDSLKLFSKGTGDLTLAVKVNHLSARISHNGDMDIAGVAEDLDLNIQGSGDFNAFDLHLQRAEINTRGSGGAKLQVEEKIKATTNGNGHIKYKGAATVEKTVDRGGRIIRIE